MRENLCVEDWSALFTGSTEGRGRMVRISVSGHLTAVLSHTPHVELMRGRGNSRHSLSVMSEDAIFPAKWKVREHNGIDAKKLERVKEELNAHHCNALALRKRRSCTTSIWTLGPQRSRLSGFKINFIKYLR